MRMIGFRTPIPEGYFRVLTAWLQAPVITALYYEDPDPPSIGALYYEESEAPTIKFEFSEEE